MGLRGPKPESTVEPISLVPKEKPEPLRGMLAAEKVIWKRIVSAYPAEHFGPQNLDLLRTYCESRAEVEKLATIIRREGEQVETPAGGKKAHPLYGPLSCARSNVANLSVKLGLTSNTNTKAKATVKPKSSRSELMFNG